MSDAVVVKCNTLMKERVAAMVKEFSAIRAGRPTIALFSNIYVDYHGTPTALNHVAKISIPEARQVIIQPWDKSIIDEILKKIQTSELSLNPTSDGNVIRIAFPPLSEERRLEYVKVAKSTAERLRISIRNLRRDANEHLKEALKAHTISDDEEHTLLEEVQKHTDTHIKEIDRLLQQKEREILEH